jgi:hypothetical protein
VYGCVQAMETRAVLDGLVSNVEQNAAEAQRQV